MTFLEEIQAIIEKEVEILGELISSAKEKTEYLLSGNIQELDKLTKREENLANSLRTQERKREEALISRGLSKETTLLTIIEKTGENNPAFISLTEKLIESLRDLVILNERNKELLNDNLSWVEFNMNLISQREVSTGYNKDKEEKNTGNSLFDKKV